MKPMADATKDIDEKINSIEEERVQTKSKSSEDALHYPIKLNDKLLALAAVVQSADTAPTQASYEGFDDLSNSSTNNSPSGTMWCRPTWPRLTTQCASRILAQF